jgi:hypothetical protein
MENSNFVYSLSLLRHNMDNYEEEELDEEIKEMYEDDNYKN